MDSAVADLAADSGALVRVSGEPASPDRFRQLTFHFGKGVLIFRCDDDTDEIVTLVRNPGQACGTIGETLLQELVGARIEYAWELRNHRGYTDGFQLRIIDAEQRETTLQLEVAASAIDLRRVTSS